MKRKRSNKYPFIFLLIIHVALLLIAFLRKREKSKTLLVLLTSNMSFAYLFEYFVLNLFHGYKYKPRILKVNFLDNVLGAILSQAFYIPLTAIFITAFDLKWKAKSLFILYFQMIELLFIKLKVYKVYWWKPIYTMLLLPIFFLISDKWYHYLQKGNRLILITTLYLSIMGTDVNINYLAAVFGNFRLGKGLRFTWKEHFVYSPLYAMILAFITTWSIRKGGWYGSVRAFVLSLIFDWVLYRRGFLKVRYPLLRIVLRGFMLILGLQFKKLIYEGLKEENQASEIVIQKSQ